MRQALLPLAFLISSAAGVSAQQIVKATPEMFSMRVLGCPVMFGAELDSRVVMRSASDPYSGQAAPVLQLRFASLETPKIISASVTVHGFSSDGRYLPLAQSSDRKRTQTFEVERLTGTATLGQASVSVSKMALVRWAELTELRYADGTAWHPEVNGQCRAVLSRFHLVDAPAR